MMKNIPFKVEYVFGDISKNSFSSEQTIELNTFFSQINVTISFYRKMNLFKPSEEKYEPSFRPDFSNF